MEKGMPIPVVITVYADRSFSFEMKTPPATYLLSKAASVKKGTATPGRGFIGKVTKSDVRKIAETKFNDLNAGSIEAACRIIEGTARNMGVVVEG